MSAAAELLGADGPFARSATQFAPRAAQQEMASAVEQTLANRDTLVVEAGTGTGKTFAYLVPALASGGRVVVSTGTKNLQDQLFFRDLPRVRAALATPARVSLLKGRSNYLCLYRLSRAQLDPRIKVRRDRLAAVEAWSHRTESGEIAELSALGAAIAADDPLLFQVTSTVENCLGAKCPDFADCHVVKARRAAQAADLVVVNHHLLFADFRLKEEGFGVLPGADAVIVDEAHQLPELATQFFGERVSTRQLLDLARDAAAEAQTFGDAPELVDAVDAVAIAAGELERVFASGGGRATLAAFRRHPGASAAIVAVQNAVESCRDALNAAAERSSGLETCAARARDLDSRLRRANDDARESEVRWVEGFARGGALNASPIEPVEAFQRFLAAYPGAWVFTSATLATAKDFRHFQRSLGLESARTLRLDSPFDYPNQARLYLPRGLPDPNDPLYADAVADTLVPLIEAADGGAFVLCTSHRAVERIAARLRGTPVLRKYPLFVQGEDAKGTLLERFASAGNGVLVATSSFWEGVDVKGAALRLVAIDRLPFGQQDDPVFEARIEAIRNRGGNPFSELQLPRAITALRQGVGRLIRDPSDYGVIAILDPRLRGKSYGRVMLASLPTMPVLDDLAAIRSFYIGMNDEAARLGVVDVNAGSSSVIGSNAGAVAGGGAVAVAVAVAAVAGDEAADDVALPSTISSGVR